MKVTITDHETMETLLDEGQAWDDCEDVHLTLRKFEALVSIVDSPVNGQPTPPPGGWDLWNSLSMPKLRLDFDDVVKQNPYMGRYRASSEDISKLIGFAEGLEDKHVLLHCAAGVSRSTAAAYIMLTTVYSPEAAWMQLRASKKVMHPNRWMVQVADGLLGHEGALLEALPERTY